MSNNQRAALSLVLIVAAIGLSGCFEGDNIYLKCDGTEEVWSKSVVVGILPRSEVVVLHKPYVWSGYKYITSDTLFASRRFNVELSGTTYASDAGELIKDVGYTQFVSLNIVSGHMEYENDNKSVDIRRFHNYQCKREKRLDGIN